MTSRFKDMQLPFVAHFWRTSVENRLLNSCPLLEVEGVDTDTCAIDLLHTWHLGPLARFIAFVMWAVLRCKAFSPDAAHMAAEDCIQLSLLRLRAEMWKYYSRKRHTDPNWRKKGSEVCRVGPFPISRTNNYTNHVYLL